MDVTEASDAALAASFAAGEAVGRADALAEGSRLGRLHGAALGFELGALDGFACVVGAADGVGGRAAASAAHVRALVASVSLGAALPPDADAPATLHLARAKAKLCAAAAGLHHAALEVATTRPGERRAAAAGVGADAAAAGVGADAAIPAAPSRSGAPSLQF
jgi:hypothetical protein